jgi:hypothetical protein
LCENCFLEVDAVTVASGGSSPQLTPSYTTGWDSTPESCAHRITFEAFEVTVTDLARCLKPRGYLVVEHSNFRFSDTAVAAQFECVARRSCTTTDCQRTPLFGPNNRLLETPTCIEIAFRKQAEKGKTPAINATSK